MIGRWEKLVFLSYVVCAFVCSSGKGSDNDGAFLEAWYQSEATKHRESRGRIELLKAPSDGSGPGTESCAETVVAFAFGEVSSEEIYQTSYRGKVLRDVLAQYLPWANTVRYLSDSESRERAEIHMPIIGGIGSLETSHAGTGTRWFPILSNPAESGFQQARALLKKQKLKPATVACDAFDWPMSGNFYGHVKSTGNHGLWGTLPATAATLSRYLVETRPTQSKQVPLCQSAGCAFLGEVNSRYPDLADGIIMIGPVIPGVAGGGPESEARFQLLAGRAFLANWDAFHWASGLVNEMTWADASDPFFGKPTLILLGENDPEVPPKTVTWLKELAIRMPHVELHIIPGARHDVLTPWTQFDGQGKAVGYYSPAYALTLIHRFLKEKILQ